MQLTGVWCCDCCVDGSGVERVSLIKRQLDFHAVIFIWSLCVCACVNARYQVFSRGCARWSKSKTRHQPTLCTNKHCLHTPSQIKRSVSLRLLEVDAWMCVCAGLHPRLLQSLQSYNVNMKFKKVNIIRKPLAAAHIGKTLSARAADSEQMSSVFIWIWSLNTSPPKKPQKREPECIKRCRIWPYKQTHSDEKGQLACNCSET